MKSKTLKKFSAIFLSVIMVMTMMPAMAFAEETAAEDVVVEDVVDESVVEEDSETPAIVYPTVDFTEAAPFLEPVEGVAPRMMRMMTLAAQAEDDNGLILDKYVSDPNEEGVYTLTLESYATGAKVTNAVKKEVPTDIVLVLDQSGSMDQSFTSVTYNKTTVTSPATLYNNRNNLYVKLSNGGYAKVTVNQTSVEVGTTYESYSNQYNSTYYSNRDSLYHKCSDNTYGKVNVSRSWSGLSYTYTYTCSKGCTLGTSSGRTIPSFDDKLYRLVSSTEYQYTFSYQNENGETVSDTALANETAPNWDFYISQAGGNTTRLAALKSAVTNFASSVEMKAKGEDGTLGTEDDIDHTISVVGFANYSNYNNYGNTEVFIGGTGYKYGTSAQGQYANAPQDMSTTAGVNNVKASISALDADGATYVDLGIEMANGILNANPVPTGEKRNRVVIIFTDGVPGYGGAYGGDSYGSQGNNAQAVADAAMTQIATTKNTHGATVYTVGIFTGADATSAGSNTNTASATQRANYFMQRLSSNTAYPQTPSYYLSASDSNALNNIFQEISQNIESGGSSITLDEESVVKDVITEYFELPEGASPDDIEVYTAEVDSTTGDFKEPESFTGANVTLSSDKKTVSVSNFDFAENWVGTETAANGDVTYRGKKLIIEIPIVVRDGFLGGNGVPTNEDTSGVYENKDAETAIENFEVPDTDVQIKDIKVTTQDKNVYLLDDISDAELLEGVVIKSGDVDITNPENLADWQKAFVSIEKTNNDESTELTEDASYKITCTVSPDTEGEATAKTGDSTSKIYVFKPVATFKDSTVYYGDNEPASFDANKDGNVVWRHFDGTDEETGEEKYTYSSAVAMTGTAPTVDFVYNYINDTDVVSGKIATKEDIPVNVAAKIGDTTITSHTTFVHTDCATDEAIPNNAEFVLHVDTCKLTIVKTGGADGEPYIFNIKKDGVDYTSVTIVGNNSVTFEELPVGTYVVTEDESWSWRYNPTMSNGTAVLSAADPDEIVTCTNKKDKPYWLDDFTSVITNVFKVEKVEEGGTANE